MSYSTLSDWELRASPKVLRTYATRATTSGSVQSHLDAAQTLVDGYVQGSYTTPLETPPQFIKDIEMRIAGWNFIVSEGVPVKSGLEALEAMVNNDYQRLRDVANGRITLPSTADSTPGTSEGRCQFKSSASTRRSQSYRRFNAKGYEIV